MDDLISRQMTITTLVMAKETGSLMCKELKGVIEVLNRMPSAQQWIPCSERLPEEDGQYIVTVKYEYVDGYEDVYSEHGEWVDGHWDAGYGHCGRVEKVLAWMPLPKSWERGQDD